MSACMVCLPGCPSVGCLSVRAVSMCVYGWAGFLRVYQCEDSGGVPWALQRYITNWPKVNLAPSDLNPTLPQSLER